MNIESAIKLISDYYNIEKNTLKEILNSFNSDKNDNIKQDEIILPFCGIINEDCCKGVIFNHALYTQCNKKTIKEYCKECSKLKYGNIYDRNRFKLGEFKTSENKSEINYNKFIKKMGYNIEDVINKMRSQNLTHPCVNFENIKVNKYSEQNITPRGRGRPKKIEAIEEEEPDDLIEVIEIEIDGILYYKTKENVILDKNTNVILGIYKNGVLESIK
jgi:hypothetical protein